MEYNYVKTCLVDVSILLSNAISDNCVPWRQLGSCSMTRPLQCDQTLPLSAKGVACETSKTTAQSILPHAGSKGIEAKDKIVYRQLE